MILHDAIKKALERFEETTSKHEMTIIRDETDAYRHIRFKKPNGYDYMYDLVTWPGYLAIVGDAGDLMFSRNRDMFDWFAHDGCRVSPDYWAEKIVGQGAREAVRRYSPEAYKDEVMDWLSAQVEELNEEYVEDYCEDNPARDLTAAVQNELLYALDEVDESEAHRRLRDFVYIGAQRSFQIGDSWEWDLREWDPHYLWTCWAIAKGVAQYNEHKAKEQVDGGN